MNDLREYAEFNRDFLEPSRGQEGRQTRSDRRELEDAGEVRYAAATGWAAVRPLG